MINSIIKRTLIDELENSTIGILGFGREGRSTLKFLRKIFPVKKIIIVDANSALINDIELIKDENIEFYLGEDYLKRAENIDVIFKSPGISFINYNFNSTQKIFSQTDLFLRFYGSQTIGVTGTKGKSTTVSLLKHILDGFYSKVLLIGNIGVPAMDVVDTITDDAIVVFELSSHQLEYVKHSPHIAILLNLFQEHLDHYKDYKSYRQAKWNIAKFQMDNDFFIYSSDELQVYEDIDIENIKSNILKYSFNDKNNSSTSTDTTFYYDELVKFGFEKDKFKLLGKHNLYNLMASLLAVKSLQLPLEKAIGYTMNFSSLPHRLEYVAEIDGVKFYNDSIATIPEATIKALESVPNVGTLILGGFNRGIDYSILVDFLINFRPLNLLLIGQVGDILQNKLEGNYQGTIIKIDNFTDVVKVTMEYSSPGTSCLLSPAASSYDSFKNFEERGDMFKGLITRYMKSGMIYEKDL